MIDLTDKETRREAMAEVLADGIDTLVTSDGWRAYLEVQSKFHRYSFGNTLLIWAQCPHATRVASFKTWLKVNRFVKGPDPDTGERQRALWIWGPCSKKVTRIDRDTGDEKNAWIHNGRFTPVPVYDISQTGGEPLPEVTHLLIGDDDNGYLDRLCKISADLGYPVTFVDEIWDSPGANGITRYGEQPHVVEVATAGRSPLQQVKTLCHEIGHVSLHTQDNDEIRNMPRALKELEAESVAFITAGTLGLDTSAYSFGYIAHWTMGEADAARKLLKTLGDRIQRAAKHIVNALDDDAEPEIGEVAA